MAAFIGMIDAMLSSADIARISGSQAQNISKRLRDAGVTMRRGWDYGHLRRGPLNSSWKGGRSIVNGYVYVRVTERRRAVQEHRLVMERILGRPLLRSEIVHHLNGIRHDNRPENLVLTTLKEHEHYTYVKALQARIRKLEQTHSEAVLGDVSGTIVKA